MGGLENQNGSSRTKRHGKWCWRSRLVEVLKSRMKLGKSWVKVSENRKIWACLLVEVKTGVCSSKPGNLMNLM